MLPLRKYPVGNVVRARARRTVWRRMAGMAEKAALSDPGALVRRHDNDRYLCALFAPAARRGAMLALLAFNLEIARIREVVSESITGQIRLAWWRETIAGIYAGTPRRHDVALALAAAVEDYGLSRQRLDALIDARERDLDEDPPEDMAALISYARATSATLVALLLEVLGAGDDPVAAEAGDHVGVAWALTGLLRAMPVHARARRCFLPSEAAARAGLDMADYFALRPNPALSGVAREIAAEAETRIAAARQRRPRVGRAALPALLPAVIAAPWLRRLAQAGHDPFAAALAAPAPGKVLRVGLAALRGRY